MTDTPDSRVTPAADESTAYQRGPSFEAPPGYQFQERFQPPATAGAAPNPATPNFENYAPDAANELVPDVGPVTPQWPVLPAFPPQTAYQPPTSYPPLANYPPPAAYPPLAYAPQASYPPPAGIPYAGPAPLNLNLEGQFAAGYQQQLPDGHRVARYGRRVGARLIDTALAIAVFFTLNMVMGGGLVITTVARNTSTSTLSSSGWTAVIIIGFVLEVVTVGLFGGQLGKLAMGIRLANARTLAPIGWPAAILRWVISTVALALCLLPGLIMMLSPLWNQPWRRGWHDRISSTIVVEK